MIRSCAQRSVKKVKKPLQIDMKQKNLNRIVINNDVKTSENLLIGTFQYVTTSKEIAKADLVGIIDCSLKIEESNKVH